MTHTGEIRPLTSTDIPAALKLCSLAGWNQTAEDWSCLLELAGDGCFGIRVGNILAATTTLFCYGNSLAWIGMVLTHPGFRRQGLAGRLVQHVVARADKIGIPTLKLDATEMGEPLYRNFGFVPEQPVERWSRPAKPVAGLYLTCSHDLFSWTKTDAFVFGANRSGLLRALLKRGECYVSRGYLLTRAGKNNSYLGPCLAEDTGSARELIEVALRANSQQGWCWDLLPANGDALALATEFGFAQQRRLQRMSRGKELRGKEELIYAIAGFEFG
jgi:GNAT superfamily N-acetyltransferase